MNDNGQSRVLLTKEQEHHHNGTIEKTKRKWITQENLCVCVFDSVNSSAVRANAVSQPNRRVENSYFCSVVFSMGRDRMEWLLFSVAESEVYAICQLRLLSYVHQHSTWQRAQRVATCKHDSLSGFYFAQTRSSSSTSSICTNFFMHTWVCNLNN